MDVSPKSVREHIARAKFCLQRGDVLRSLRSLAQALSSLVGAQIVGRERIEIGILLEEAVRLLMENDALKRAVPGGIVYKKGHERELAIQFTRMADALEVIMEKARLEERRRQLAELDGYVLAGQAELDKKEPLEARRFFRRAVELYGDEPGLFLDVGTRLMLAGLPAEAVEYLQKGMETAPTDPRSYRLLAECQDALGEGLKAEETIKSAVRRFGPDEYLLVRLARGAMQRRAWPECLEAAKAALGVNPTNREALACAGAASTRLYGDPQAWRKPREAKAPAAAPVKDIELKL